MSSWLFTLTLIAALGSALMAGALFAFSSFVMHAAMQSINVSAMRPVFMAGLFGTAATCVALVVIAFVNWGDRETPLLLAGSALYLVGTILLTMGYHVPLNNALADIDPNGAGAAAHWTSYVSRWTAGNHVRVLAGLAAAAVFTLALTA